MRDRLGERTSKESGVRTKPGGRRKEERRGENENENRERERAREVVHARSSNERTDAERSSERTIVEPSRAQRKAPEGYEIERKPQWKSEKKKHVAFQREDFSAVRERERGSWWTLAGTHKYERGKELRNNVCVCV